MGGWVDGWFRYLEEARKHNTEEEGKDFGGFLGRGPGARGLHFLDADGEETALFGRGGWVGRGDRGGWNEVLESMDRWMEGEEGGSNELLYMNAFVRRWVGGWVGEWVPATARRTALEGTLSVKAATHC